MGGNCTPPSTCDFDLTLTGDPAAGGTFQVQNQITSTANVVANTDYFANEILLENDFEVTVGAQFLAEINPCSVFSDNTVPGLKIVSTGPSNGKNQTVIDVNIVEEGKYSLRLNQGDDKSIIIPAQKLQKGIHRIRVNTEETFSTEKVQVVKE